MWIAIAGVYIICFVVSAVHEHLLEDLGNNTAKGYMIVIRSTQL